MLKLICNTIISTRQKKSFKVFKIQTQERQTETQNKTAAGIARTNFNQKRLPSLLKFVLKSTRLQPVNKLQVVNVRADLKAMAN